MAKNKRTPDQIRKYIEVQVARQAQGLAPASGPGTSSADGALISGTDLKVALTKASVIPDTQTKKEIHGLFQTLTKYQVLSMLTNPAGKYMKTYGEVMQELADAATLVDMTLVDGTLGRPV